MVGAISLHRCSLEPVLDVCSDADADHEDWAADA
jgi:hypothetical protein